jgi:pimeloyl-ACP methyl ester carboxylesterase
MASSRALNHHVAGKDEDLMTTTIHEATTPELLIEYEQTGPETGHPVLLLHGWPYDPRSYDKVRTPLANAGCRVIVPYLRGFGRTTFRSATTMRSGQQAALGKDVIDLLDALKIEKATLVGYDWGGRAACVAAALWPERVHALVSATGYTIQDTKKNSREFGNIEVIHKSWYRWFLNTPMGERGLVQNREGLARELWKQWSPKAKFSEGEFEATAGSFDNPDWIATTLHCYRDMYANAPGDPALERFERALADKPKISVPTIVLQGDSDGLYPASVSEGQESLFTGYYERRVLKDVGHCPPRDGPQEFVKGINDLLAVVRTK